MTKAPGARLLGAKALDQAFDELTRGMRNQAGRQAVRETAKDIILPEVKHRVPEDEGTLLRSLTVRSTKLSRRTQKDTVGMSVETREGWFQGETFYGGFLEFGWYHWKNKMPLEFSFMAPVIYNQMIRNRCVDRFEQLFRQYVRTVRLKAADKAIAAANRSLKSIRVQKADRSLRRLFG
ncbi:MAG: HK97-gp10 family putative phage morphogenesis protein [Solirubrobacterales bacterium]